MASEWPIFTFSELLESGVLAVNDGYRAKNSELGGDGPIFLRGGLVQDGRISLEGADRFRAELHHKLAPKLSQPFDVVVTTKGWSTGRTTFMRPEFPQVVYSPHMSFWRSLDRRKLNPTYLRQWARSRQFVKQLEALAGTCTLHPYLSLTNQHLLRIELPPLHEQRRIAAVLGALDDKIELNRKMNRTLEEMAQAIFKSWFIDFDGVPDSELVESELGPIPRGWGAETLTSLASYLRRGLSPKYTEEGGVRVINQKCIRHFRVDLSKARRHDPTKRNIDGRVLEAGDVLINSTGVGTLGRVAQLPAHDETLICDSHVTVVRAGPETSSIFLGASLMHRQPQIESLGHGSTGQTELGKKDLERLVLVVPPSSRQQDFERTIRPLKQKMLGNARQSGTLSSVRDTLLPKLISGELRVPEAEAAVEDAL